MKYLTLKEVRVFLGLLPIKVTDETLEGVVDGVNKIFYTKNKPIVDFDYDGQVIDDVSVKVNNVQASVSSLDVLTGKIELESPPAQESTITVDYYWHPFSDEELKNIIESVEDEIDNYCGRSFEQKTVRENILLTTGNVVHVSRPPIMSIISIKLYGMFGEPITTLTNDDYIVFNDEGKILLKKYQAGVPVPPWYIPSRFYVEIEYVSGGNIPKIVKEATKIGVSLKILEKIGHMLTTQPEYQGKISVAFKTTKEVLERVESLRSEFEKIKSQLPRRVEIV